MFLAWRDMLHARGRFGLMALVVTLVAFLVVVLGGLIFGLIKDCVSALQQLPATHMAFENSTRPDYQNSMLDKETWEKWAAVPGVRATPIGHSLANARDAQGAPVDIAFWGVVPGSFAEPQVIEGQGLSAAPNAMVISRKIAMDKHDLIDQMLNDGIREIARSLDRDTISDRLADLDLDGMSRFKRRIDPRGILGLYADYAGIWF